MTPSSQRSPVGAAPEPLLPVTLTVNGERRTLTLDPRTSLLDAHRDQERL